MLRLVKSAAVHRSAACAVTRCLHSDVSAEEMEALNQEPPPRDFLTDKTAEKETVVPGDSFGIMRSRVTFYRPIPRQVELGRLGELFPEGTHPQQSYAAVVMRHLSARFNAPLEEVAAALQATDGNMNHAVSLLERKRGPCTQFGQVGVVCLESYVPETFCLASFNLPSLEAAQDPDVLETIHELTLSASELPLDIPPWRLIDTFMNDWTVEDNTPCRELMKEKNIEISRILLLPHGDYSVQGFYVLNPVDESFPNIGTAAAACCLDLRTGIHNRFRFHVERIADSVSEHVIHEMLHYNQGVHVLRQPYWFRPEYSVEEYIRFKESLLQPSASTFEMRYGFLFSQMHNLPSYCNVVEMEKLKVAQHKYEKHYEDFTAPGRWVTSDGANLQTVAGASGGPNVPGGAMHYHANDYNTINTAMETRTAPLRKLLASSMQKHGDRVFDRFYRNNYF